MQEGQQSPFHAPVRLNQVMDENMLIRYDVHGGCAKAKFEDGEKT
jgi:hypothetical protein